MYIPWWKEHQLFILFPRLFCERVVALAIHSISVLLYPPIFFFVCVCVRPSAVMARWSRHARNYIHSSSREQRANLYTHTYISVSIHHPFSRAHPLLFNINTRKRTKAMCVTNVARSHSFFFFFFLLLQQLLYTSRMYTSSIVVSFRYIYV
jgi:hypothetical protein